MNPSKQASTPIKLAIPIFIELLLFMVMGNVDTIMLSRYSDSAVAAVGNQVSARTYQDYKKVKTE